VVFLEKKTAWNKRNKAAKSSFFLAEVEYCSVCLWKSIFGDQGFVRRLRSRRSDALSTCGFLATAPSLLLAAMLQGRIWRGMSRISATPLRSRPAALRRGGCSLRQYARRE
jgi:hypothetical protein